jgi:superfamily II DNA or RNA helicase
MPSPLGIAHSPEPGEQVIEGAEHRNNELILQRVGTQGPSRPSVLAYSRASPLSPSPHLSTLCPNEPESTSRLIPSPRPGPALTGPPMPDLSLPTRTPEPGDLVQLRSRRWLVEEVTPSEVPGRTARVRLACADDDAQGQPLEVYWDYELDRRILREEGWEKLGQQGFDEPRQFAAFLHTLRWNCVTATDPNLFQAPFRAGIKIDAYQMEPLRKALRMPRVNLFIADDTGLGKTIEAGLIARELLLRKKVKSIVVAAPPSVLEQWKAELEERFGLLFEILDREYWARMRRERGYGVNPWHTHSRFLVSHKLLIDPAYADPLRSWLEEKREGKGDGKGEGKRESTLLILDEAHHAAPASGSRYGIETKFTRAVRDLGALFDHRLFLSATPHNGHSNSFSTLLELLDPYRFTRGVKAAKEALKITMVRRLKEDIRELQGGFPKRRVVRHEIAGLPADAPELELSVLLDKYRTLREQRTRGASKRAIAAAGLLVIGLQQRLLSSIEAFARTLAVHRRTVEAQRKAEGEAATVPLSAPEEERELSLFEPASADEERAAQSAETAEAEEDASVATLSAVAEASAQRDAEVLALWQEEQALLDRMQAIAQRTRSQPDAKLRHLLDWIREHQCPGLPRFGESVEGPPPRWTDRRVLIFTENREGTKRYLRELLSAAIEGTDHADERIEVIDGLTSSERRKEIQRRFNTPPQRDPLRILLATDAAREGLNFQAHCADLFHFDLPWNPGRIEQRNGRIDRKLQPEKEVRCHYFVLPQRVEDRVLQVLVEKTETIKRELGSLSQVIDDDIEKKLRRGGIRHRDAEKLKAEIAGADLDAERKQVTQEELESTRERSEELKKEIETCQDLIAKSRAHVGFKEDAFREALSCSLELLGADGLEAVRDAEGREQWRFPPIERLAATDPSWLGTLDSLRAPRGRDQDFATWRREAPIRPVVFEDAGVVTEDTVHLHLEQRIAQRLLGRFRAQGFVYHDLSRACLTQTKDAIPRVVLLGRLSLFGRGAERLHEEIVPITARWADPSQRKERLKPYAREAESKTLELLESSLTQRADRVLPREIQERLRESAARDIEELLPHLEPRAQELGREATERLRERGEREARELLQVLESQKKRVAAELRRYGDNPEQLELKLDYAPEEQREFEANVRSWRRRVEQFDRDAVEEPGRVRAFYDVVKERIEPIGLVYLWPETN